jgi:hypothetical protein
VVVQLLPGDVVHEPLIGLDSATYQAARTALAMVPAGEAVQANLRHRAELADQQLAVLDAELRRCRAGTAADWANLQKLAEASHSLLERPPRPPLLLDSHFYQGTALGVVVVGLLKLLVFH